MSKTNELYGSVPPEVEAQSAAAECLLGGCPMCWTKGYRVFEHVISGQITSEPCGLCKGKGYITQEDVDTWSSNDTG